MDAEGSAARADLKWRRGGAPEPALTVSEWAGRHRMLPATAAEPGRWRNERVPYLREVMDCLSASSPVERVILMKGAQLGGTEAGLNWLGYVIHHSPGTMMMVQPTVDSIRRNTVSRIDPLIADSPVLRDLVVAPRSREPGNSAFRKAFPGGQLVMTGANSGVGLRSLPARFLFLDEVDGYPGDVDGEGDPVALAVQRTATFRGRRKVYLVSTPGLKDESRIEAAYLESDQRRYLVPCRACAVASALSWKDIRWPPGRRAAAFWACPECGAVHEEADKPALLANGFWQATAEGDGSTAGFHLSSLYSPFETWGEIAVEHGAVYRDPPRLQAWTNMKLAETWEDQAGEAVEADPLLARREDWGAELPEGVVALTAGVDLQGDRIEVQVVGWGRDEEAWIVDYRVLWGDPSGPRVWADLDAYLGTTFAHRRAVPELGIHAVCIDTGGHHTKAAYAFCLGQLARRRWAIKGRGGPGVPVWPKRPSKAKGRVPLFIVGVDAIKDALFARLRLTEAGPGCLHFSAACDPQYFRQLTAERVVTRFIRGRPIRAWVLKRAADRNEALDTLVYAMAALHGLMAMGLSLNREADAIEATPLRAAMPAAAIPARPKQPTTYRSNWMRRP